MGSIYRYSTTILAVSTDHGFDELIDYAFVMAFRLDCRIIFLDVTDNPLQYQGESNKQATRRFNEEAQHHRKELLVKAKSLGVTFDLMVKIGKRDDVVKELIAQDMSIRYVLSEPKKQLAGTKPMRAQIPTLDLSRSYLQ